MRGDGIAALEIQNNQPSPDEPERQALRVPTVLFAR
jgi:hypothetical protein